tara:strand:+ start:102 stop:650 length:549 start_codon:yes stop_codon:yes gene_type:complete
VIQRIVAIGFIFASTTVAWIGLGATLKIRPHEQDAKLKSAVGQLWGSAQRQQAPSAYWIEHYIIERAETGQPVQRAVEKKHSIPLNSSQIDVDLQLDYRRKGLLWYATYGVQFTGIFSVANPTEQHREVFIDFALPDPQATYDDFNVAVDGAPVADARVFKGRARTPHRLGPRPAPQRAQIL